MEKDVSRRQFLELGMLAGAAAFVAACSGETNPPTPQIYQGEIQPLDGRPVLSEEHFDKLTQFLIDSLDPFLAKVAQGVTKLHKNSANPPEFPSTVSENSTPLVITRDYSGDSMVDTIGSNNPGFEFQGSEGILQRAYYSPEVIGINIGLTKNHSDPANEAILLAKEYLSMVVHIAIIKNPSQFLPSDTKFFELDGTPMDNPDHLNRASYSLIVGDGLYDRLTDVLPVILLGQSLARLYIDGKLPKSAEKLFDPMFESAVDMMANPNLSDKIYAMTQLFTTSSTLLPDEKAFAEGIKDPEVLNEVDNISYSVYGNAPNPTPAPPKPNP